MGGRLAAAVGLAVLGLATGRYTAGQEQERGWAAYDGRDWRGVTPAEKRAYVVGVLAAGALAEAGRGGAGSPAALRRVIDSLSRGGGVRFPFGHTGRSGERRVGEEGRSRWGADHLKKKNMLKVTDSKDILIIKWGGRAKFCKQTDANSSEVEKCVNSKNTGHDIVADTTKRSTRVILLS